MTGDLTAYLSLLFGYFFFWTIHADFPPPAAAGLDGPGLLWPMIALGLIVLAGPWFLGEVNKNIDLGLAPLPRISEAGNKPMRPWITVEGVYVAAPSKNKEEAYAFAKYLTDVAGSVVKEALA